MVSSYQHDPQAFVSPVLQRELNLRNTQTSELCSDNNDWRARARRPASPLGKPFLNTWSHHKILVIAAAVDLTTRAWQIVDTHRIADRTGNSSNRTGNLQARQGQVTCIFLQSSENGRWGRGGGREDSECAKMTL